MTFLANTYNAATKPLPAYDANRTWGEALSQSASRTVKSPVNTFNDLHDTLATPRGAFFSRKVDVPNWAGKAAVVCGATGIAVRLANAA